MSETKGTLSIYFAMLSCVCVQVSVISNQVNMKAYICDGCEL